MEGTIELLFDPPSEVAPFVESKSVEKVADQHRAHVASQPVDQFARFRQPEVERGRKRAAQPGQRQRALSQVSGSIWVSSSGIHCGKTHYISNLDAYFPPRDSHAYPVPSIERPPPLQTK